MQRIVEEITLSQTASSTLPLAFRKVHLDKIPLWVHKQKLLVHNEKYQFDRLEAWGAQKPVSKILY